MQLAPPSLRRGLPSSYDAPIASGPRVHPLGRSARPGGAHLCARLAEEPHAEASGLTL